MDMNIISIKNINRLQQSSQGT